MNREQARRSRPAALAALLLAGAVFIPAQAALEADMARIAREEKLAGIVWAATTPEGTRLGAVGFADFGTQVALAPDARVHVGSVAKAVLAMGVLRLVTVGRLSLDTPLADVLPGLEIENEWSATHPVRVRHLLEHTAGVENARLWQVFSLRPTPDTPLLDALERPLRVRTPPGRRFSYSNVGYTVLGMVIEAVTGRRYEDYLDAEVLRPLQMNASTFAFTTQRGERALASLAMGHFEGGVAQPAVPWFLRPAAQFTTTAADMARFAAFLLGDGRLGAEPFIEARLMARLARPEGTEAAQAGLEIGHGLALSGRDRHGARGDCHAGTTVGFRAMLCIFPGQGKSYFFAVNTDSETANYERLNATLVAALHPEGMARPARTGAGLPAAWKGFYVPRANSITPFAYADTLFGAVWVAHEGGDVRVRSMANTRVLEPVGGGIFRATDRTTASHVFFESSRGARVLDTGVQSFERMNAASFVGLGASLGAGLLGLAYLLGAGVVRMARRRLGPRDPLIPAFAATVALAAPVPFFLGQSFLQLGDLTVASGLLACVSGLLPVGMAAGLVLHLRRRERRGAWPWAEAVAMVAVLQWTLVLAAWGMLPIVLWT